MNKVLLADRQLRINKRSATATYWKTYWQDWDSLLYMDMINVSHASPALQGHYEHLLGAIYRDSQHV